MRMRSILISLAYGFAMMAMAQTSADIHTHPVFVDYRMMIEQHGAAMEETFPLPQWTAENHIAFMDSAGIGLSVLTMPAPQPYFGDISEARNAARNFNIRCSELMKRYPGRFRFCAALPLPDIEGSIREAVFAMDSLGADGVKIPSNSRGLYLGDERLDSLMAELGRRKAVVIIHPHHPEPVNDTIIGITPLPVYEYPAETTRAVLNLIARNVLAHNPGIKLVVPHCGSFLPLAIPRVKALLPAIKASGYMNDIDWEANLKGIYFDLAGTPSPGIIKQLLAITEPSHIMYGSDYPYLPEKVLIGNKTRLYEALSADRELSPIIEDLFYNNAIKLFTEK